MSDSKEKRNPQDSGRINVNEDYEVRYWTGKFGVNEEELRKAVEKAGTSAKAVEELLKGKGGK